MEFAVLTSAFLVLPFFLGALFKLSFGLTKKDD